GYIEPRGRLATDVSVAEQGDLTAEPVNNACCAIVLNRVGSAPEGYLCVLLQRYTPRSVSGNQVRTGVVAKLYLAGTSYISPEPIGQRTGAESVVLYQSVAAGRVTTSAQIQAGISVGGQHHRAAGPTRMVDCGVCGN